jgi:hypothetical protein
MSLVVYAAILLYVGIFVMAYFKLKNVMHEATEEFRQALIRGVNLSTYETDVKRDAKFLVEKLVVTHLEGALSGLLTTNLWLCVVVIISEFVDEDAFDRDFRLEFVRTAAQTLVETVEAQGAEGERWLSVIDAAKSIAQKGDSING